MPKWLTGSGALLMSKEGCFAWAQAPFAAGLQLASALQQGTVWRAVPLFCKQYSRDSGRPPSPL